MNNFDLEEIASQVAKAILEEEVDLTKEKDKQKEISDEIASSDLKAKSGAKDSEEKRLTDEAEDEDDEDKEEEEEEEVDVEPKPKPKAKDDEDEDEGGFEVESKDENIPSSIKFDDVKKQINNLRAGGSLKDEKTAGQLEDYFDKLGQADTKALFVYLSSVASILTGGTSGVDALRPEDADVELNIKEKEKEKTADPIPGVEGDGEQAPIIVGEVADNSRTKLRLLETLSLEDDHRCIGGKVVKFGSPKCMLDLETRIEDAAVQRDMCPRKSADRVSLNGMLNYLRQKLRLARKLSASE